MDPEAIRFFALHASSDFGQAVSRALDLLPSAHEERTFDDGEHKVRPLVNVRGGLAARGPVAASLFVGREQERADGRRSQLLAFQGQERQLIGRIQDAKGLIEL